MNWDVCRKKGLVKDVPIDKEIVEALVISAQNRYFTLKRLTVDKTSAATIVCLQYDCLREVLEAIALQSGLKIYQHDCYTTFILEAMQDSTLSARFDNYRKLRNEILYLGKQPLLDRAQEIIIEIEKDYVEILRIPQSKSF